MGRRVKPPWLLDRTPADPDTFEIPIAPGLVARSSGPVNRVPIVEDYGPVPPPQELTMGEVEPLPGPEPGGVMEDPYDEQVLISDVSKPALTLPQLRAYHLRDERLSSLYEPEKEGEPVVAQPNVRMLWYWMNERHRIWKRKTLDEAPFPWTRDPILGVYRFCNVFRELDTVTIWIRKNWREPYAGHPNMWFAMAIARLINWPATLAAIGFPNFKDDAAFRRYAKHATEWMNNEILRGRKVYTGAYMLRGDIQGNTADTNDKPSYTFKILEGLWKERYAWESGPFHTLQSGWKWFNSFPGMGPFLSYEVVTDLRWADMSEAADIYTWANAGPGAIRGLNRLAGRPLGSQPPQELLLEEMRELLRKANEVPDTPLHPELLHWATDAGHPHPAPGQLEMRDIEHSLCEFDKYMRVLEGTGRPRAKYNP